MDLIFYVLSISISRHHLLALFPIVYSIIKTDLHGLVFANTYIKTKAAFLLKVGTYFYPTASEGDYKIFQMPNTLYCDWYFIVAVVVNNV